MSATYRRATRFALAVFMALATGIPVSGQDVGVQPREIGKILDEVIRDLLPADQLVSRVPASDRALFIDYQRTLAAFKVSAAPLVPYSALQLTSPAQPGSRELLDDCRPYGDRRCDALGWGVYLWVEPVSSTPTETVVRAHLFWPDRGDAVFQRNVQPTDRASLVGFSAEMVFARAASGSWELARRGAIRVY